MNGPYGPPGGGSSFDNSLRNARNGGSVMWRSRRPEPQSLYGNEPNELGGSGGLYDSHHQKEMPPNSHGISLMSPGMEGMPRSVSPDCFDDTHETHSAHHFGQPQYKDDIKFAPKPASLPGAHFCSNNGRGGPSIQDAISQKIASNGGPNSSSSTAQIEIAPGVMARLRGAQETWQAVANDFYMPTTCFCCTTNLFCIMDANYVICPVCKVVSPMEGCAGNDMQGGVGLGFTMEDLQQWQTEIIQRQRY